MTPLPSWYRALPLRAPAAPPPMAWAAWYAEAVRAVGRPSSMLVESWWAHAWRCGVDPTGVSP